MKHIRILIIALIVAALPVICFAGSTTLSISKPTHVICSVGDDETGRTVTWWAPYEDTDAELLYGENDDLSDATAVKAKEVCSRQGMFDDCSGYRIYEAEMKNLQPGCDYYYKVTGDHIRQTHVADASGGFSFLYFGDAQYNKSADDYDLWQELFENAYSRNTSAAFVMLGGDMVNFGQDDAEWDEFLQRADDVLSKVPAAAAAGNHECNAQDTYKPEMMLDIFSFPQNGPAGFKEEFYSFDYGDCHIQVLNSDVFEQLARKKITAAELEKINSWIRQDLKDTDKKWKVAVTHHPAYAVVDDTIAAQVMKYWEPIFSAQGADLVLCGHQHVYMRTKNMNGVTYVMGVSGSKLYSDRKLTYAACSKEYVSNYQTVNIKNDTMTVKSLDKDGNAIDEFKLTVKGQLAVRGLKVKTAGSGKITVSCDKNGHSDGRQIKVSTVSSFKSNVKTYKISGNKKTVTGLKKGKTYYIKIRNYRKIDGKLHYGSWSSVKKIKVK